VGTVSTEQRSLVVTRALPAGSATSCLTSAGHDAVIVAYRRYPGKADQQNRPLQPSPNSLSGVVAASHAARSTAASERASSTVASTGPT
jgi:hypothetical protein